MPAGQVSPAVSVCEALARWRAGIPVDGVAALRSDLLEVLASVPDPRAARGKRYPLVGLLAIAILAVAAGMRGYAGFATWARTAPEGVLSQVGIRFRRPSEKTFRRVLASVDAADLDRRLGGYFTELAAAARPEAGGLVAVSSDGKTVRGAVRGGASGAHLVSVSTGPTSQPVPPRQLLTQPSSLLALFRAEDGISRVSPVWITLATLVLCLLVLVAVVIRLWTQRSATSRAEDAPGEDDVPVGWARRRAQELHVETLLPPSDPQVSELAAHLRDDYSLGDVQWDDLAPKVLDEMKRHGPVGVDTASFIVTSALADFQWELDFLENWNGVAAEQRAAPIRSRFLRVVGDTPASPFSTPSGFHPLTHLVAALKLLTAHPVPELARPLEDLLEFWLAYAESKLSLEPHDVQLLETLVDCYRSTQALTGRVEVPRFLTELVERDVALPARHPATTGAAPQQHQALADTYSLSSLAARAGG